LRNFGIISVLAFASLRGFKSSRSRISLNWPFLWKRRTRNQKIGALARESPAKLSAKQKTKHNKVKNKEVDTEELQSTYLG
jgi:hypothetical protein